MTRGTLLDAIGRTPMVRLARLSPNVAVKLELKNPGGSIKDRPALAMVRAAEAAKRLAPGATIVEATSGNTGISLAMIAAVRGYACVLVMPEDMSLARRQVMRAYGAEILLTPAAEGMAGAVAKAETVARETPGAFMPRQFENEANPAAHEATTALEILDDAGDQIAAFVAGVGTGGTITGVGRALKRARPNALVVAVEPSASAVLGGGAPGRHRLQGLGAGFVPKILDLRVVDEIVPVTDAAAEKMARRCAREEGILVGPSTGANLHVACEVALRVKGLVVTIACDGGERYFADK